MATEAAERIDEETISRASERLATIGINAAPSPAAAQRVRKPRSDAGTKRTAPAPGMVAVKFEVSVAEATDMLGYFVRTGHTQIAHALVDALAKAAKNGE